MRQRERIFLVRGWLALCGLFLLIPYSVTSEAQVVSPARPGKVWHVSEKPLAQVESARQFRSIGAAAKMVEPGDTVLIHSGTYREQVLIEKSGTPDRPIRFEATPAANVIVTGADRLTGWRKEAGADNIFSTAWPHSFINWSEPDHTHPGDDYHRLIGRAEQVFVFGYPLRQVLQREQLSRGTFFVDLKARRLYIWNADNTDLSQENMLVEGSTRSIIWESRGDYIHLRGLRFRYAANQAQQGAALFHGQHTVIEDCVFERMNTIGAMFAGINQVARRCVFQDNGQLGFSAYRAHNLLFTEDLVTNNNTKGFNRQWEAGGNKIVLSRGVVLEQSRFISNRGTGIWFDIGNEAAVVRNCLIADNEDAGIFYEISYGLHAHDNVIMGNGLAGTPGYWGVAAGISLSSAPDCIIERNLIVGNREGFNFREQSRTTPRINGKTESPIWNHDEIIRHNILAYNLEAQTWGWFDVNDERHWPAVIPQKKPDGDGKTLAESAKRVQAGSRTDEPVPLSLDKLNLTLTDNLYATMDGQGLFNWGTTWRQHKRYTSLNAVRQELNLEQGSRQEPFVFQNYRARDFRVPPDSPALRMNCYPRGTVPGAQLGIVKQ